MKILWFANTPCGASEYLNKAKVLGGGWLYSLSQELSKLPEIELHIAFYWGNQIDDFEYKGIFYHPVYQKDLKTKASRAIARHKMLLGFDSEQSSIQQLIRVVEIVAPDLIHIHGTEENFGLIAEQVSNIPIVISIQGLLSSYFEKLYSGFSKQQLAHSDRFVDIIRCRLISQEERLFYKKMLVEKRILKSVLNIIGRTDWDKRCTLAINPKRQYFSVGEILRDAFYSMEWTGTHKSTVYKIVTTSSPAIYKGLETIYRTAQILDAAGVQYEWAVIGVSKVDKVTHVANSIIRHPSKNIKLLGFLPADDISTILCESDCYVQVSHIENSPNSLCEAMVLGMPIIASNAGGSASLFTDNQDGILVQDGDPYILAGSIIEFINNGDKYKKMGQNARIKALERHNPQKIVRDLINTYKCILEA